MHDEVTRENVIRTDLPTAWAALTEPDQVAQWFGDQAEIDLRVGGAVRFGWPAGEVSTGVVTAVDPPHRFAFRWDVFGTVQDRAAWTEVGFELVEQPGGVAVRVRESGLDRLVSSGVSHHADELFEEHVDGWRNEMADLGSYLSQVSTRR